MTRQLIVWAVGGLVLGTVLVLGFYYGQQWGFW